MREGDLPAVADLLGQLGYEVPPEDMSRRFFSLMGLSDHLLLVAEAAGKPVGSLHAFVRQALEKPLEAVVQSLVVDGAFRRMGAGMLLMKAAEAWAAERGLRSIALATRTDREAAHGFYRAFGYNKAANSYLMRKNLGS